MTDPAAAAGPQPLAPATAGRARLEVATSVALPAL